MLKKIGLGVFLLALCFSTAMLVFFYGMYRKVYVQANRPAGSSPAPEVEYFNNQKPYTVALLGYGGGTHQGGKLTDSVIVAQIHPQKKKVFLISIPRDVWVQLPINGQELSGWKINAAYAIGSDDRMYRNKPVEYTGEAGGGELAKFAINQVTGLTVDKFVAVSFSGFKKSINVLGGVEVNVEKTFDDYVYPIEGKENDPCGKTEEELVAAATMSAKIQEEMFPCRYEHLHFDKGITKMDADTALKYVRSRHSLQDGTDFGRAARQRNLIQAVKAKVISLDFFAKIIPFISSLSNDIKMDISLSDMQTFLKYKDELIEYEIVNIPLTEDNVFMSGRSQNGQFVLMSKEGLDQWTQLHTWLQEAIENGGPPEPSPTATPAARSTSKKTPPTSTASSSATPISTP